MLVRLSGILLVLGGLWLGSWSLPALAQDDASDKPPTAADDPDAAKDFIAGLADRVLAILNNTTMTQDERDEAFREELRKGFALNRISRLVLGRHWRTANQRQRAEYLNIFPEYVLKVYVRRLTEFGDEEFVVGETAPAGKKDIYVRSQIVRPEGPPIAADWRVTLVKGELKIIDLKVEGVSMALTQREDFSARIAEVGMEGLLKDLRDGAEIGPSKSEASLTP